MKRMRNFFRHSIGNRLLLYFTLLMMLPLSVVGWLIYHVSDSRMSSSALRLSAQVMDSISEELNQMLSDVEQLGSQISADTVIQHGVQLALAGVQDREDVQLMLSKQLKRLNAYYKTVNGAYIILDGGIISKSRYYTVRQPIELPEELYRSARDHSSIRWSVNAKGSMIVDNMGSGVLSAVSSLSDPQSGRPCGVIVVEMKLDAIKRSMSVDLGEHSNVLLIDRDSHVIAAKNAEDDAVVQAVQLVRNEVIGDVAEVFGCGQYFIVCARIKNSGWTVAGLVYKDFLRRDSWYILSLLICIAAGAFLLNIAVSRALRAYEMKPIMEMRRYVKQVENGEFSARLNVMREDEIGGLAASMNNMAAQIGRLLDTVQQEQERLRLAEYKALQAQINPHFLYNTLDSIDWLIWAQQNDKASEMVTALTHFFRIGLSRGSEFIPVKDEVEHVKSYLTIQKIRYSKSFDYTVYMQESVADCRIPKLLLQPLAENALYHGIRPAGHKCQMLVNVLEQDGSILLEVRDNGIGMTKEQLQGLRNALNRCGDVRTDSYGMCNVNDRIHILAGRKYGIEIVSEQNIGTSARMTLPKNLGGMQNVSGVDSR